MDLTDLNVQLISETIFPINRLARINKKKEKKKNKKNTNQKELQTRACERERER